MDSCVRLASDAERCSVLCTCESSGDLTKHAIARCSCCLLTVCGMCAPRLQLETHSLEPLLKSARFGPTLEGPAEFEQTLRREVPDVLRLKKAVAGLGIGTELFRLARVERERGCMQLRFVAHGASGPVASLSVELGRLEASGTGIKAVLLDMSTGKRGALRPAARLLLRSPCNTDVWEVSTPREVTLQVEAVGDGRDPSFRNEFGLLDFASEEWPASIRVSGASTVAGTYERQSCRGSIAFGALWKRSDGTMYFFVDPNVNRTGLDRLVFATTPTYLDGRAHHMGELLLKEEEPVLEWLHASGGTTKEGKRQKGQKGQKSGAASRVLTVRALIEDWTPQPAIEFVTPKDRPTVAKKAADGYPAFAVSDLPSATTSKLKEHAQNAKLTILAASSTLNERRLAESLAAPLLRFDLKTERGVATPCKGAPKWGECEKSAPPRPPERWTESGDDRPPRRSYDPAKSNEYERLMNNRSPMWEVRLAKDSVEVRPLVPVAAHQAAEKLLRFRCLEDSQRSKLSIEWQVGTRLDDGCELDFPIKSSVGESQAKQPPVAVWSSELKLYARQLQVLRWLQQIEEAEVDFEERDFSDAQLPSVGWQLQAKAAINSPLRGGALCDALGAGKTVTIIALIASDTAAARAVKLTRAQPRVSRASLVVVPPLLVWQWQREIERFSGGKLRCVTIESAANLETISYKQLREADIVLMASDLLGSLTAYRIHDPPSAPLGAHTLVQCLQAAEARRSSTRERSARRSRRASGPRGARRPTWRGRSWPSWERRSSSQRRGPSTAARTATLICSPRRRACRSCRPSCTGATRTARLAAATRRRSSRGCG